MESLIRGFGYVGLFVLAYLSATIIPFSAEFAVLGMVATDHSSVLIILVATAGSFLGALTNYYVGLKGGGFVLSRWIRVDQAKMDRAEKQFNRFGQYALFFSWLPLLGDALTVVAGVVQTDLRIFTFWVLLGRLVRQTVTVLIAARLIDLPRPELCIANWCF